MQWAKINGRPVGEGHPCWVIAEMGINHGGHLPTLLAMIDAASDAGADAIKIQVMNPEAALPLETRLSRRDTPWGNTDYVGYRSRLELSLSELKAVVKHCHRIGMTWFPSVCDLPSLEVVMDHNPPCLKIPSAFTDRTALVQAVAAIEKPVILSTGMSDAEDVEILARFVNADLLLMHCTSSYPCEARDVNLLAMRGTRHFSDVPVGYSGHERGFAPTLAAVTLGAVAVERHFTLSRKMWGSDQACSLEPQEFAAMAAGIREIEAAMGDGVKRVLPCELPTARKFRGEATVGA